MRNSLRKLLIVSAVLAGLAPAPLQSEAVPALPVGLLPDGPGLGNIPKGGLKPGGGVSNASTNNLTTTVGTAVHFEVPYARWTLSPHLRTYAWSFGDPNGSYNELNGFNAAHVYDRPGIYGVRLNGRTVAQVRVQAAEAPTPVKTAAQLQAVLEAGGSARLPPGTLLLRDTIRVGAGARLVGNPGGSSQLFWIGPERKPMLESFGGGLTVENVIFTSRYTGAAESGSPDGIRLGGENNTIIGCRFSFINTAVNGNGRPDGTLVQDCTVNSASHLRSYLVWGEGRRWTILGNRVPNSTREEPVRLSAVGSTPNCEFVLVWGNALSNVERPAEDRFDAAKSALRVEAADLVWVERNDFGGIVGAGPLGEGDGVASADRRANYVVFRSNTHRGAVRLKHGLQHFLLEDSRIDYLGGSVGGWVTALTVDAFDPRYNRYSSDLTLRRNVITTPRRGERQVWVQGPVLGTFEFSNNTLVQGQTLVADIRRAPIAIDGGWQPGYVSRFNTFPAAGGHGWPNPLAVAQVGSQNDAGSYLVAPQWLAQPNVEGDQFVDVPVP